MKLYRVSGAPVQIGAGEVIGLTKEQVSPRVRKLEVVRNDQETGMFVCRPIEPIEFKAGERLLLAAPPAKAVADRLVPVDGQPDGRIRSEVDRKRPGRKAAAPGGQQPKQS